MLSKIWSGLFLLSGCQTIPGTQAGIQPEAIALLPGRIVAIPTLPYPNPLLESRVDTSLMAAENLPSVLEKQVLQSFKNQPQIHGVAFSKVVKTLDSKIGLVTKLRSDFELIGKEVIQGSLKDRSKYSKPCLDHQSFLDFYAKCIAPNKTVQETLQSLSLNLFSADTALLLLVNQFDKKTDSKGEGKNAFEINGHILLVDTNNGALIWGREFVNQKLILDDKNTLEPQIMAMISDKFWDGFPGRIPSLKRDIAPLP